MMYADTSRKGRPFAKDPTVGDAPVMAGALPRRGRPIVVGQSASHGVMTSRTG
jgi:hypothetical protein